jgi:hypothetical protein
VLATDSEWVRPPQPASRANYEREGEIIMRERERSYEREGEIVIASAPLLSSIFVSGTGVDPSAGALEAQFSKWLQFSRCSRNLARDTAQVRSEVARRAPAGVLLHHMTHKVRTKPSLVRTKPSLVRTKPPATAAVAVVRGDVSGPLRPRANSNGSNGPPLRVAPRAVLSGHAASLTPY